MYVLNDKLNFHVKIKSGDKHFYVYFLYSNGKEDTGS